MMIDSEMGPECQLLKPVCLRVAVARNLSASWYHGCADIEMHGQLQEISVDLFSVLADWLFALLMVSVSDWFIYLNDI